MAANKHSADSGSLANTIDTEIDREDRRIKSPARAAKEELAEAMRLVEKAGFVVHQPEPATEPVVFDTSRIKGDRVRIGIVSDTHFGSKYQQKTHLQNFMRYAAKTRKVDCFIHGGDVTDGPFEAHRGAIHEMWTGTYDGQRDTVVSEYPDTGKKTYAISGNHDEFYMGNAGGDIVKDIARIRDDVEYIGGSSGYMKFGDVTVAVMHPHDGSSYALSYKLQKRIESLSPENKPHILALGNYHKVCHLPAYRNTEGFLLPAFQSQTGWMARKGLASIVGGLIVEFGIVNKGLAPSLTTEWVLYREVLEGDW